MRNFGAQSANYIKFLDFKYQISIFGNCIIKYNCNL